MKNSAKKLAFAAVFVALIVVGAFITIPVAPVPFTLQTLFVLMAGACLGGVWGLICVAVYIAMGLIGLPVFAGGGSGFSYVLKPSFGFTIGFAVAAFLVGAIVKKDPKIKNTKLLFALGSGTLVIYVFGILYYIIIQRVYFGNGVDFWHVLLYFWIIFIPSDIVKCAIAFFSLKKVLPVIYK